MRRIGKRAAYRRRKTLTTSRAIRRLTTSQPTWARPSNPQYESPIAVAGRVVSETALVHRRRRARPILLVAVIAAALLCAIASKSGDHRGRTRQLRRTSATSTRRKPTLSKTPARTLDPAAGLRRLWPSNWSGSATWVAQSLLLG